MAQKLLWHPFLPWQLQAATSATKALLGRAGET